MICIELNKMLWVFFISNVFCFEQKNKGQDFSKDFIEKIGQLSISYDV